jgi:hypothetical protein
VEVVSLMSELDLGDRLGDFVDFIELLRGDLVRRNRLVRADLEAERELVDRRLSIMVGLLLCWILSVVEVR